LGNPILMLLMIFKKKACVESAIKHLSLKVFVLNTQD
jgi:hypothetical protein